jgi:hypothetical protein
MSKRSKIFIAAGALALVGLGIAIPGCLSLRRDPHELAVGAAEPAVPAGALLGADGKVVDIDAVAGGKLAVLVFYRGRW